MALRDCLDTVKRAGGDLTDQEALAILERLESHRERLQAEGRLAGIDAELRRHGRSEAERGQREAILRRRHAAMTIVTRDRLDGWIDQLVGEGLAPDKAILAVLEGTTRNLTGARRSMAAHMMAYESRYLAPLLSAITRERPHLERLLSAPLLPTSGRVSARKALMDDLTREMHQPEGAGRATGNADAHFLADQMRQLLELSRTDLNRLGADIGRLDGYLPHSHDDWKVGAVSEGEWVDQILPRLDRERTFGDIDANQIRGVLGEVYRTIVSGRHDHPTARERGEFTGPPNRARSLARNRVLHFRDADAWLGYQQLFGRGDAMTAVIGHLRQASRMAGQMSVLGPNPEALFRSVLGDRQRRLREANGTEADLAKLSIDADGWLGISAAWRELTGLTSVAENRQLAHYAQGARNLQSMAKLGQALLSSVSDLVTNIANMTYRGRPIVASWADALSGYLEGRGQGERRELAFLMGEGFDGVLDSVISPYAAVDGPPGWASKALVRFFRLSGLTWWTDTGRAVAARVLSADLGRLSGDRFDALPEGYQRVLRQHGIDAGQWDALRSVVRRSETGTLYLTPDRAEAIDDRTIEGLIQTEVRDARQRFSRRGRGRDAEPRDELTPAQQQAFDVWHRRRMDEARLDLELSLRRLIADEGRFAVIGGFDPSVDRLRTFGRPPGTLGGEAVRSVMQFKGYPVGFTRRVLGRAVHGGAGRAHVGHLVAGMLVAGFGAMTMKDALRGWEPRDPTRWQTWLAAGFQSGGLGIFGDFLFAEANRFGGGPLETLAGPSVGTAAEVVSMVQELRDGEPRAGRALNFALSNTPFANLFYVRPALDYLLLNALRESVSPGTLRRAERRRERDYGQRRLYPAVLR